MKGKMTRTRQFHKIKDSASGMNESQDLRNPLT